MLTILMAMTLCCSPTPMAPDAVHMPMCALVLRPGSPWADGATAETPAPPWAEETDPFRKCARKALAGEFGELEPWQETGYRRGLERGMTCDTQAWLTVYGPWEGRQGRTDRRGRPCSWRTAAANAIPENSWVWSPVDGRIRQVRDCGAKSNDRRARRRGATVWVDLWHRRARQVTWGGSMVTNIAVIPRGG